LAPYSQSLGLQARTLEIFENMGIIAPFLQEGIITRKLTFHQGKKKKTFPVIGIPSPYPFLLIIPQSQTEKILWEHFTKLGGKVEWNTEFVGYADGKASLLSDEQREELAIKWIAGCDGAHSQVRRSAHIPFTGMQFPEAFFLTDVRLSPPLEEGGHIFFSTMGFTLTIPYDTQGTARVIFPVEKEFPLENLQEKLQEREWSLENKITHNYWHSLFTIHRRIALPFWKGSFLLLGDAAHIHSPAGGQGMNTGIQDAVNLAWKLALILKQKAHPNLLLSYCQEREVVAKKVLRATTLFTQVILALGKKAPSFIFWLLNFVLSRFSAPIFYNVSQVGICYTKSPLTHSPLRDFFWKGPRAGARAPEIAPTTSFLLLLFKENPSFSQLLEQNYGIKTLVIQDAHKKALYKAQESSLYLIRPDGYIGYRAKRYQEKEVINYLLQRVGYSIQ
jgi:2-polyprenyl-6-methoxyphenol hydroxylase-like FAD-dependent oxidoreductase